MAKNNHDDEIFYEFEKKRGKALPITIILIVAIGFVAFFLMSNKGLLDGILDGSKEKEGTGIKETEAIVDKDFVTGLRLASIKRYDEAISYFEEMNFNKLSEADQFIVLQTYLNNDDEQKALDLSTEFDEEIIKKYLENDEMDGLENLETNSRIIEFEIAVLNNDYERIVELKDINRLKKDERRGNAIANAYYKLGEKEEAVNYTSLMVLDGINMWESSSKVDNTQNELKQSKEKSSEKTGIGMFGLLVIVIVVSGIGAAVYFVYINKDKFQFITNKENKTKVKAKKNLKKKLKRGRNKKIKTKKKTKMLQKMK